MNPTISALIEKAKQTNSEKLCELTALYERYNKVAHLKEDVDALYAKTVKAVDDALTAAQDQLKPKETKIPDGVDRYSIPGYHLKNKSSDAIQVIEVTGIKDGARVAPRCFGKDEMSGAKIHLRSLDQGNSWLAEAVIEDNIIYTISRKRINLMHPHCLC